PLADPVRGPADRLEDDRHCLAALAVDADPDGVALVDVELQPGAAARDHLDAGEVAVGGLVRLLGEVDTRRTDKLADHDPFPAVADEPPPCAHHPHATPSHP